MLPVILVVILLVMLPVISLVILRVIILVIPNVDRFVILREPRRVQRWPGTSARGAPRTGPNSGGPSLPSGSCIQKLVFDEGCMKAIAQSVELGIDSPDDGSISSIIPRPPFDGY